MKLFPRSNQEIRKLSSLESCVMYELDSAYKEENTRIIYVEIKYKQRESFSTIYYA